MNRAPAGNAERIFFLEIAKTFPVFADSSEAAKYAPDYALPCLRRPSVIRGANPLGIAGPQFRLSARRRRACGCAEQSAYQKL